jgi:hypothetical protein
VDATAYPAAGNGTYVLPGVDFYVAFGVIGTCVLATVLRDMRPVERAGERGVAGTDGDAAVAPAPEAPDSSAEPRPVLVP